MALPLPYEPMRQKVYRKTGRYEMGRGFPASPGAPAPPGTPWEQARAANIGRYEEIKGGYAGLERDLLNLIQGMGAAERGRIGEAWQAQESGMAQNLMSRGLSSSTLMPAMQMGVERGRSSDLLALSETLARRRAEIMERVRGQGLGFMERREDVYPEGGAGGGGTSFVGVDAATMAAGQGGGMVGQGRTRRQVDPRFGGWSSGGRRWSGWAR